MWHVLQINARHVVILSPHTSSNFVLKMLFRYLHADFYGCSRKVHIPKVDNKMFCFQRGALKGVVIFAPTLSRLGDKNTQTV